MAIFFSDTFTGSGSIDNHVPDIGFPAEVYNYWSANVGVTTLSGGSVTNARTSDLVTQFSYQGYNTSLPANFTGTFIFTTGPDITPNVNGHAGIAFTLTIEGVMFRYRLYSPASGAGWLLSAQNATDGTGDEVVFPGISANTSYTATVSSTAAGSSITVGTTTASNTQARAGANGLEGIYRVYLGGTFSLQSMDMGDYAAAPIFIPTATVTFTAGGAVAAAMPMPTVVISQAVLGAPIGIAMNMPTPIVALSGGANAQAAMPMPVIQMTLNEGTLNSLDAAMPMPTVALRLGNNLAAAMPMATLAMTGTTTGMVKITASMPMPTIAMTVRKTESVKVAALMPMPTLVGYGGSLVSATISGFTVQASVTTGSVGRITATMPMFELECSISSGARGSIDVVMPMLVAGPYGRIRAVMPMGQLTLIGHAVVAVSYEAYAVNLNHSDPAAPDEVTRYTNFPFTQVVRYQNSYYGVNTTGMYLLEGTLDVAAPIPWAFKTAPTDLKSPKEKRAASCYFGGRLGPASTITLYPGESAGTPYAYTTPRGALAQNHRETFGLGIRARYFALGAAGTGVMKLDDIEFNFPPLTRRI